MGGKIDLMFILVTVLLVTGVTTDRRGCGRCLRNERCIRGRCQPRFTQLSMAQQMLEQILPARTFPQGIPPDLMMQAAQFIHPQDLMGEPIPTERRPLIVSGHPSLLSQISALPLISRERIILGQRDDDDSTIRRRIVNRRRQKHKPPVVDESEFSTFRSNQVGSSFLTEISTTPPTVLPLQGVEVITNDDDSVGVLLDKSNAPRPLHDHSSDPDKHFHFEDVWAYPWSAESDSDEQMIDGSNTEDESLGVSNIDDTTENEIEEVMPPDDVAGDTNTEEVPDETIISDIADSEDNSDDVEENAVMAEDNILDNSILDDNAIENDNSEEIADATTKDVIAESTEDDMDGDDFNEQDAAESITGSDEGDSDEQETESIAGSDEIYDSTDVDSSADESMVELDDNTSADTETEDDSLFDTWSDTDYENMKSVILDKADDTPKILQTNEANSVGGFNRQREGEKDEDSEENDGNLYAFASVPVALLILVVGIVLLFCYWSRIKSRWRQRNKGQSNWLEANRAANGQSRKASSSSVSSLISTRPKGKMSVVSVCETITEEGDIQGIASLAEKITALENTYIDVGSTTEEKPTVSTLKEGGSEERKDNLDHEYAEIGAFSKPLVSRQRTVSSSSGHTYVEWIDDIETGPPSYNEVMYDSNPSVTTK